MIIFLAVVFGILNATVLYFGVTSLFKVVALNKEKEALTKEADKAKKKLNAYLTEQERAKEILNSILGKRLAPKKIVGDGDIKYTQFIISNFNN